MLKCKITNSAYQKIRAYVTNVNAEISGIGKTRIIREGDNDIIMIDDVVIFKQRVTGSNTILEDSAQSEFMDELMRNGEDLSQWNLWWHSHHTMNVFWSSTDTGTMEQHAGSMPFLISLVTNLKDEFKVRLDVFESISGGFRIKNHQYIDDIETSIMAKDLSESEIEYVETLDAQSEELAKEKDLILSRVAEIDEEFEKINVAIDDVNGFNTDEAIDAICKEEILEKVSKPKPVYSGYYDDYSTKQKYHHQIGFGEYDPYPDNDYLDFSRKPRNYTIPFSNTEEVNLKMKRKLEDIGFSVYMDEGYLNSHSTMPTDDTDEEPSEDFNKVNKALSK